VVGRHRDDDVDEFDVHAARRRLEARQQVDDFVARRQLAIVQSHADVRREVLAEHGDSREAFLLAL
jgi:hypothetical protein